jgi:hypothetical protein
MKNQFALSFLLLSVAGPAFASVVVTTPANNATVTSPFSLSANGSTCSSQTITSMGYSLDNSRDTTIVHSSSVQAKITSPTGSHKLHVKAWGNKGAVCVSDVPVTVEAAQTGGVGPTPSGPVVPPSDAISVSSLQMLTNWKGQHDTGTAGSSSGAMNLVSSPSLSGTARQFSTSFSGNGGELYHVTWGDDTEATNFLYDGWVYINGPSNTLANIEMDMNQVQSNGDTVIYGFQCDGWSGTWDYTGNLGTPSQPKDHWFHSTAKCNPRNWSVNTWHHVQIAYSRDSSGVVTYQTATLDGVTSSINATTPSAFTLGWAPTLITNFQVDGVGTGQMNVYLDNLTISRW